MAEYTRRFKSYAWHKGQTPDEIAATPRWSYSFQCWVREMWNEFFAAQDLVPVSSVERRLFIRENSDTFDDWLEERQAALTAEKRNVPA